MVWFCAKAGLRRMEKAAAIDNTMYFMIFSLLKVGCDRSSGDAAHNKAVSRRIAA